jgi:hypothetical protein
VGTPRPAPLGILTPEAAADKPGEAAARDYCCSGVADVKSSCFLLLAVFCRIRRWYYDDRFHLSVVNYYYSCQVLYHYIYMVVELVPEPIIPSAFYRLFFLPMTIPSYSALLSFI